MGWWVGYRGHTKLKIAFHGQVAAGQGDASSLGVARNLVSEMERVGCWPSLATFETYLRVVAAVSPTPDTEHVTFDFCVKSQLV